MPSIYLHIPFCKQACHYCNFHFTTSLRYKDDVVSAICKEAVLQKHYTGNGIIETIYFGGGTPSLLDLDDLRQILQTIRDHFPVSARLGVLAMLFATLGGIVWGALTANYRDRLPDIVIMFLVVLCISVPSFVFAALGQLAILRLNEALGVSLLPVAGWGSFSHMIVPATVLGLGTMAFLTRLMRSSMLEVRGSDYVRTARAKGLSPLRIFFSHQLRNAILPVITVLGPAIAAITTGGFVVELVFAIPGLGRYFVQAVQQLDYTVIMGTTVFYGSFLVFMVIVVDILYGFVDPRIRVEKAN